jgi:hypothetical protein
MQHVQVKYYDDYYRMGNVVHHRTFRVASDDMCNGNAAAFPLLSKTAMA